MAIDHVTTDKPIRVRHLGIIVGIRPFVTMHEGLCCFFLNKIV